MPKCPPIAPDRLARFGACEVSTVSGEVAPLRSHFGEGRTLILFVRNFA
jgi:hypothetical protein